MYRSRGLRDVVPHEAAPEGMYLQCIMLFVVTMKGALSLILPNGVK